MVESFFYVVETFSQWLWGPWTMAFIAFVSIYLTVKSRFFQLRHFQFIFSHTLNRIFYKHKILQHQQSLLFKPPLRHWLAPLVWEIWQGLPLPYQSEVQGQFFGCG
jgi:hypothetical protein